jgi:hypothetical protein
LARWLLRLTSLGPSAQTPQKGFTRVLTRRSRRQGALRACTRVDHADVASCSGCVEWPRWR